VQMLHDPFGPMREAGMFGVLAIANMGVTADSLHALLMRDLLVVGDVITLADLEKAKNVWRASTIFGRQRAEAIAEAVHHAAMFLGSPSAVNTEAARYDEVTLDDLRRVARTYLRPTSSLTLQIVPEAR
jgi:zinc protease